MTADSIKIVRETVFLKINKVRNTGLVQFFLLLKVDGAGGRHCAPILCDDRQVSRAVVIGYKVLGIIVGVWVSGVICDFTPDVVCKVV